MIRISQNEVELTDEEMIVSRSFDWRLDIGMGIIEAADDLRDIYPDVMTDDLYVWLTT